MMNRPVASRLVLLLTLAPALLTGCAALRAPSADPSGPAADDARLAAADSVAPANPTGQALPLRIPRVKKVAGERPDHPGEAMAFRYRERLSENGRIPPNALLRAVEDKRRSLAGAPRNAGIDSMSWTELGPGNIGGRIRSILIHPTTPATMWVGGVAGGVWKTTNAGAHWDFMDDFLPSLPIGCMALDPTNPDVLYAGTGEGFGNIDSLPGAGILKSVDGGVTWAQIPSTIPTDPDPTQDPWGYVNRIAISPASNQIMLVATKQRIFRTTNGGTSWTEVFPDRTNDVRFHPTDGNRAVAGTNAGTAIYSTDGGVTWQTAQGITSGGGRVEVAYARSSPSTIYASVNRSSGEVWRSTNGGQSYTLRNTGTNYLGNQGWYDNAVWVDPTNSNIIVLGGGPDAWRSTNGGSSLTRISQWASAPLSAHADHHVIVEHPGFNGTSNRTVYFGNDGGIYRTDNVHTVAGTTGWIALNNNLAITQFYGGAVNNSTGVLVGGTQDNGTLRTAGSFNWTAMFGGDGGYCAADQNDANYFYGEYVYLRIHRSTNAGVSSSSIYASGPNPLTDASSGAANFIAPFVLDPNNSDRLLGGAANLWRSNNVKNSPPHWFIIKPSISSNVSAIAIAAGNSDLVWVGHNNGNVYKTTNGTDANPTWTRVDTNTPNLPNRTCKRIAIDPSNHDRVYVGFSGYEADNLWKTTDGGTNWTKITGPGQPGDPQTLPRAPVDTVVLHPALLGWLYVGTDIGVFASTDYGETWSSSNDGPANVAVDELVFKGSNTLIAITHGRGMFSATIDPAGVDCNGNMVEDITELDGNDCNGNQLLDVCELTANPALDCNANNTLDACELAGNDCNNNSVLDTCELIDHPERDCNNNSIVDTCEPGGTDCDVNGVVDLCEIAGQDCNANNVIDSCDLAAGVIAAEDCPQAMRVLPGVTYTGSTIGAASNGEDTCNPKGATPPDLWFRYDPASNGEATISLCGSTYDSIMSVHDGCPGTTVNELVCDDDFCGGGSGSQVTLNVSAGSTYWVRVTGWSTSAGEFELRITGPSAFGDHDCNANGILDACEPELVGPAITQQPQGIAACEGDSVEFSVTAIGMAPLSYKWRKGGVNIPGEHAPTLALNSVTAADAGDYDVEITNPCGSLISVSATFELLTPVTVDVAPDQSLACAGASVQLVASAAGDGPLTHQWRRNGQSIENGGNISGADTDTLTINPATAGDTAADYECVVTGACGAVTSAVVQVSVFATGSGDIDGDNSVTGLDIAAFVQLLLGDGEPGVAYCAGDMTGDGLVTEADIPLFVGLLLP